MQFQVTLLNEFGEDKHETAEDKIKKFFKK